MVYQETEKTMAHKAAQRTVIIGAAIDIIGKEGWTALTAKAVVERSNGSMGKLYNLFPDMAELLAQAEATVMHRDRLAMEQAAGEAGAGARAVVAALTAIFDIFATRAVSRQMMSHSEAYRDTLTKSLSGIIAVSGIVPRNEAKDCARAALGALFTVAAVSGPRSVGAHRAILFVLRGLGVSERKATELAS